MFALQAHPFQQLQGAVLAGLGGKFRIQPQSFLDGFAHSHAGVQAGGRVLKDHLQVMPDGLHLFRGQAAQVEAGGAEAVQIVPVLLRGAGGGDFQIVGLVAGRGGLPIGLGLIPVGLDLLFQLFLLFQQGGVDLLDLLGGEFRPGGVGLRLLLQIGQLGGKLCRRVHLVFGLRQLLNAAFQLLADDEGARKLGAGFQLGLGLLVQRLGLCRVGAGRRLFVQGDGLRLILAEILLHQVLGADLIGGFAMVDDFAAGGIVELQDGAAQRGFAAAALAHDAEFFAAVELEGDVVHGRQSPLAGQLELLGQIADLKQNFLISHWCLPPSLLLPDGRPQSGRALPRWSPALPDSTWRTGPRSCSGG